MRRVTRWTDINPYDKRVAKRMGLSGSFRHSRQPATGENFGGGTVVLGWLVAYILTRNRPFDQTDVPVGMRVPTLQRFVLHQDVCPLGKWSGLEDRVNLIHTRKAGVSENRRFGPTLDC
jgi:hypothetical protein